MNPVPFIAFYSFFFVLSMLFHELMHIKSQGIKATGTIFVHPFGMTCSTNNVKNWKILYFGGGLLTAGIFAIFALFLLATGEFVSGYTLTLTVVVQALYGLLEGFKLKVWGNGRKYLVARYTIYVLVPIAGYVLLIP